MSSSDPQKRLIKMTSTSDVAHLRGANDWIFESSGQPNLFRIRNGRYRDEYLHAGPNNLSLDPQKRELFTTRREFADINAPRGKSNWMLLTFSSGFRIVNLRYGELLYTPQEGADNVGTWRPTVDPSGANSLPADTDTWIIEKHRIEVQ